MHEDTIEVLAGVGMTSLAIYPSHLYLFSDVNVVNKPLTEIIGLMGVVKNAH